MIHSKNLLLASITLAICPWLATSVDVSLLSAAGQVTGAAESDIMATDAAVPPGPQKCWLEALKIFQPVEQYDLQVTSKLCEGMAPNHQKALAFELARCHLQDLGRDIVETLVGYHIDDPQDCVALDDDDTSMNNQFPNLQQCLFCLTDFGAHTYTTYLAHVVSICNRLTQHMVIGFQQRTAIELAKISSQTIDLFTNTIQRQQDAFYEREAEMRKRHEDFYETMRKNQETLRQDEASRMEAFKTWTAGLFDSWKLRDKEQVEQHSAWMQNLTKVWEDKAQQIEQRYIKNLASASNFIQPLLSFDTLLMVARHAYRFLAVTLHGLFVLFITWFFTRPHWCRRVRGTLFAFVLMETVAEMCVHFLINDLVTDDQKLAMVASLRHASASLEILAYVVGFVLSCCWCPFGGEDEDLDDDYDEDETSENNDSIRRDEMRMEFRQLMSETGQQRANTFPGASMPSLGPPGTTPLGSRSATVQIITSPSDRGLPSGKPTTASCAGGVGIVPTNENPSATLRSPCPSHSMSELPGEQVTLTVTSPTLPALSTGEEASLHASMAIRNNEEQNVVESKGIAPVTGLVSDNARSGQLKSKKRASEDVHSSEESDSDASEVDVCGGPTPSKRRRVVEEEYHTAAEDDYYSTEDEGSEMDDEEAQAVESEDKDSAEATMEE